MSASKSERPSRDQTVSQLLTGVPMANEVMETSRAGDGLLVSIPIERPKWLVPPISWVVPFSKLRRVQLDAIGRAVLEACDGRRTVEEVIERFAAEHKLSFRESQLAVTRFLRELVTRGIIVIVGTNERD